ncbi:metal ABC transporter substrate-binding protein [Pseudomonas rhizoryzae]|uniref:metal ABC transporter substrate-binding protein n=1 Tax=Pseudomonas rhizoryzae TaxID=2571129 RepID=UPI00073654BA|nr:metal ABC transporter substrate-binding protein [Pseudomonas rhizoryzae]KTS99388.1 metal ABC transporter substrate-binding protein [Pseudomonas psychrotolerans]KTT37627.1 metal ABC transporter substrate-binding protein [Pseudomonas psychrotolerans]KTT47342.1 metal ABC transporter substrate-binding protein [Pseudomonas psychrotolerans]KTT58206.1 metal ABC transporter substrate-binding protein [Pseudomonas psychrotolerans]KTT72548.1 metal ABC transporter substrate-binding protein [Pseudomonas
MKSLFSLGAALLLAVAGQTQAAEPIKAVATFTVIADVVKQVGGNHVQVTSLVGPNGDPHAYEPTPADAQALKQADVVFMSGLHMEGWMDRLIKASGQARPPVILSEGIKTREMAEDEDGHSDHDHEHGVDPHVWNNPLNVVVYTRNVVKALSKIDPADAAVYQANGDKYIAKLEALDRYAREQIAQVPKARRKVLTSHDAFGYFGDAYGVQFISPLGISTEAEASAQDVGKLIRQIKKEHVAVYFFENSNDPRLVEQIAKASGAQPGGELYVEALSPANGPAPTYADMFRYNVDTLVKAMKAGH